MNEIRVLKQRALLAASILALSVLQHVLCSPLIHLDPGTNTNSNTQRSLRRGSTAAAGAIGAPQEPRRLRFQEPEEQQEDGVKGRTGFVPHNANHSVGSNTDDGDFSRNNSRNSRRHLLQDTSCNLILKDIEYAPTAEHPNGYSREEWMCELPSDDSSRIGGIQFIDIADATRLVEESNAAAYEQGRTTAHAITPMPPIVSGESTLTFSSAIIDTGGEDGNPKLHVPQDSMVKVKTISKDQDEYEYQYQYQSEWDTKKINDNGKREQRKKKQRRRRKRARREQRNRNGNGRRLSTSPSAFGTLNTLVVRVVDRRGIGPDASIEQLYDDVFGDTACLKSQYEACSYGKMSIVPARGGMVMTGRGIVIQNGVTELRVNYDVSMPHSNKDALQQAVLDATLVQFGTNLNVSPHYDLVLFCMPPGTGDWIAYAFVNHKFSFYNNQWCSSVTSQLHEVGHNLGLDHSGEYEGGGGYVSYADQTGAMGFSYDADDMRICFNPAKSYQLGWYADQVKTINPLAPNWDATRQFLLNGVSDYQRNPETALIVLRLDQMWKDEDYYIGYNRKHGINDGTFEDPNKVTIVRKEFGKPHEYGLSTKVAALGVGESYVIENFNDEEGKNVEIKYIGHHQGVDVTIEIVDLSRTVAVEENAIEVLEELNPVEDTVIPECAIVTIEITFDRFPEDITWSIEEANEEDSVSSERMVYASNPVYDKEHDKENTVATHVCLPYWNANGNNTWDEFGNYTWDFVDANSTFGFLDTNSTWDYADANSTWDYADAINTWDFQDSNSTRDFQDSNSTEPDDDSMSYRFIILDSYGDGLCCGQGEGSYRGLDAQGNEIFSGGTYFSSKEHLFRVFLPFGATRPFVEVLNLESDPLVRTETNDEDTVIDL